MLALSDGGAMAGTRLRGLQSQLCRLRPLGWGAGRDAECSWLGPGAAPLRLSHEPVAARFDPSEAVMPDDAEWRHYSCTTVLLQEATPAEFEAVAADVLAYRQFPDHVMKVAVQGADEEIMRPGDNIVQRIPLLPALPWVAQTLAVVQVCEVLAEPRRRGFVVATTTEHEEVAEHTLWVEHCPVAGDLLLHSRGVSRWAEHVPRFLWGYTRQRYQHGHLALRRQLLRRARRARATERQRFDTPGETDGEVDGEMGYTMEHRWLGSEGGGGLELISARPHRPDRAMPPVLLLHGAFHSAAAWEEVFLPLFATAGVATHALSVSGSGLSAPANGGGPARLDQWLADIDAAVAALSDEGGRPPVLVGHSAGGGVAQAYARAHPERLSALGLVAAFPATSAVGSLRVLGNMAVAGATGHPAAIGWAALLGDGATAVAPTPAALRRMMGCPRTESEETEREDPVAVPAADAATPLAVPPLAAPCGSARRFLLFGLSRCSCSCSPRSL